MAKRVRAKVNTETEELKEKMLSFRHAKDRDADVDYIPTGSTLLNLAASQKVHGGWARGRINNFVGDGSAGKTICALEACFNFIKFVKIFASKVFPKVKEVIVKYNNRETVMDFPIEAMYGEEFMKTVEFFFTETVEDFGADFFRVCREWKPGQAILYVVDSWDALDSETDLADFDKGLEKRIKGKKPDDGGSYNLGKQKYGTQRFFKKCCAEMAGKDITLLIISQTRENIGVTFGAKKKRTGGAALDFFTHQVAWLREVRKLKKTVYGEDKFYGVETEAKFKRNKTSLPFRTAKFCILFDYGIDDIMSNLNYLFGPEAKKWDIGDETFKDIKAAIRYIEDNDLEDVLKDLVAEKWYKAENALIERTPVGGRKRRY